mmetsp:Transcript_19840/g.37862  ORF Transcript_19840/g.37862 Transcript_19840/m.37862 type:complete len:91 (-) Transcript_19840:112-384(-)
MSDVDQLSFLRVCAVCSIFCSLLLFIVFVWFLSWKLVLCEVPFVQEIFGTKQTIEGPAQATTVRRRYGSGQRTSLASRNEASSFPARRES